MITDFGLVRPPTIVTTVRELGVVTGYDVIFSTVVQLMLQG